RESSAFLGIAMFALVRHNRAWTLPLALLAAFVSPHRPVCAQQPSLEDVTELKARYQDERQKLLRDGAAKKLAHMTTKADESAGRADRFLADGRLRQASESFRQA